MTTNQPEIVSNLSKSELASNIKTKLPQLREAAAYADAKSPIGCGFLLICGIPAVIIGISSSPLLAIAGGLAIAASIWVAIKSDPTIVVIESGALIVLGASIVLYLAGEAQSGSTGGNPFIIAGVILIGYGGYRFTQYDAYQKILENKPPADIQKLFNATHRFMQEVKAENNEDILDIQIKTDKEYSTRTKGRIWLLEDLFIIRDGYGTPIFIDKDKVSLSKQKSSDTEYEVSMNINGVTRIGYLNLEDWGKYERWKQAN